MGEPAISVLVQLHQKHGD